MLYSGTVFGEVNHSTQLVWSFPLEREVALSSSTVCEIEQWCLLVACSLK